MLKFFTNQEFIETLRKNGYKATPQRIAIFEILKNKDHPSAEEIYESLKKKYPSISLTTVYQTLHLFSELGIINELGFSDDRSRFDTNTHPHVNIICPICGKIRDLEDESVLELWKKLEKKLGKTPIKHRFDVYVICDTCEKKIKAGKIRIEQKSF